MKKAAVVLFVWSLWACGGAAERMPLGDIVGMPDGLSPDDAVDSSDQPDAATSVDQRAQDMLPSDGHQDAVQDVTTTDTPVTPTLCCETDDDCPDGWRCELEILACVEEPGEGACWGDEDCAQGLMCIGAYLCPCMADGAHSCDPCKANCQGPDEMGTCLPDPKAMGCCQNDEHCLTDSPEEKACVISDWGPYEDWGVCVLAPQEEGWCWEDLECGPGMYCHGAAICPCGVDCDMAYEGPGVCLPLDPPGPCVEVQESWVKEYCNAASITVFDGSKCVQTCPGCCHCEPFCEFTFGSLQECQEACLVPTECQVFDGDCDGAIPENPWWYWDGDGCVMENSCVCEGCPGTFISQYACETACGAGDPQGADECPVNIGALANCHYRWEQGPFEACPHTECLVQPCETDQDCPLQDQDDVGGYCVTGNCVYCWQDSQCSAGQVCRTGRCVAPDTSPTCPDPGSCDEQGCHLSKLSESNCPVCVCDSLFSLPCEQDMDCLVISMHPYSHCVNGRCAECRSDDDCGWGRCRPPGTCYTMEPLSETLFGTWMIGWAGGLNHMSYFRFEPDGTLRRGTYPGLGNPWADDIPPLPCDPGWPPQPMTGTWEPEVTQSGLLIVRLRLNVGCDAGDGWSARYAVQFFSETAAEFADIDDGMDYMAEKLPTASCTPAFTACVSPSW